MTSKMYSVAYYFQVVRGWKDPEIAFGNTLFYHTDREADYKNDDTISEVTENYQLENAIATCRWLPCSALECND
jgi:hypothetical protein